MRKILSAIIAAAVAVSCASARQPQRGYRGFIDWSNDINTETMWSEDNRRTVYYTGLSTSHGYQFNPWLYVGAGLDYEYNSLLSSHICAPFVHGRTDLLLGGLTPFGEVRFGYNLARNGGIYFSPNIGYRFNWGRKVGINLGVGLTLVRYSYDVYDIAQNPDGYWTTGDFLGTKRDSKLFFSFRLGFDF